MNHYDDLQRFKDKTRTQNLEFKDLSAQTTAHERGDWAILEQLSPSTDEVSSLGVGGSVSQVVPQPVSADAFVPHEVPQLRPAVPDMQPHERHASSIMQSVTSQMAQQPEPEAPAQTVEAPLVVTPPQAPRVVAAPPAPAPQPVARKPAQTTAAENNSYSHLFAPKTAEIVGKADKEEKDQPLKSLLERIASCR
jgi:hypothetical protein